MKKILNLLTAIVLISSSASSVISCKKDSTKENGTNINDNNKIDLSKVKWLNNFYSSSNSEVTVDSAKISKDIQKNIQDKINMHWNSKYGSAPVLNKDYRIDGLDTLNTKSFTIFKKGNKTKLSDYSNEIWQELTNLTGFQTSNNLSFINDQQILNDKTYTKVGIVLSSTTIHLKNYVYIKLINRNNITDSKALETKLSNIGLTVNIAFNESLDNAKQTAKKALENQYGIQLNDTDHNYTYTWGINEPSKYSNYYSYWTKINSQLGPNSIFNTLNITWNFNNINYKGKLHFLNTSINAKLAKTNFSAGNYWNQNLTIDSNKEKTLKLLNKKITIEALNPNKMIGSANLDLHLKDTRYNIVDFNNQTVYSKLEKGDKGFDDNIKNQIHSMLSFKYVSSKDYDIIINNNGTTAEIKPLKNKYSTTLCINDSMANLFYWDLSTPTQISYPAKVNIVITSKVPLPKIKNVTITKYDKSNNIHNFKNITADQLTSIKTEIKKSISNQIADFKWNIDWDFKNSNDFNRLTGNDIYNNYFIKNKTMPLEVVCSPFSLNYYGSQKINIDFAYDLSKIDSIKKSINFTVDDASKLTLTEANNLNTYINKHLTEYFEGTNRLDYNYKPFQPGLLKTDDLKLTIKPNSQTTKLINSFVLDITINSNK